MQPIIDFFSNIFTYLVDAASAVLSWFLGLLIAPLEPLLQLIADAVPDCSSYWSSLSELTDFLALVNTFFPLYESGLFISFYASFIAVFLLVKYIVKIFIPFVG